MRQLIKITQVRVLIKGVFCHWHGNQNGTLVLFPDNQLPDLDQNNPSESYIGDDFISINNHTK